MEDGDVIDQGRPKSSAGDNHESLYVKVVQLGTEAMISAIEDIGADNLRSYPLKQPGQLYLSSKVTPAVVAETWEKVKAGVIRNYAENPQKIQLIGKEE